MERNVRFFFGNHPYIANFVLLTSSLGIIIFSILCLSNNNGYNFMTSVAIYGLTFNLCATCSYLRLQKNAYDTTPLAKGVRTPLFLTCLVIIVTETISNILETGDSIIWLTKGTIFALSFWILCYWSLGPTIELIERVFFHNILARKKGITTEEHVQDTLKSLQQLQLDCLLRSIELDYDKIQQGTDELNSDHDKILAILEEIRKNYDSVTAAEVLKPYIEKIQLAEKRNELLSSIGLIKSKSEL